MKTLILNGSPRKSGDSAFLLSEFKRHHSGEIIELSAYYDKIAPCNDCRACYHAPRCVIQDDMAKIYADDFDKIVLAAPIYMCTLPGPMVSLISRLQVHFSASRFLGQPIAVRPKTAALFLCGGGSGKPDAAISLAKLFFSHLKAQLPKENIVLSLDTDQNPAHTDAPAIAQVEAIARAW